MSAFPGMLTDDFRHLRQFFRRNGATGLIDFSDDTGGRVQNFQICAGSAGAKRNRNPRRRPTVFSARDRAGFPVQKARAANVAIQGPQHEADVDTLAAGVLLFGRNPVQPAVGKFRHGQGAVDAGIQRKGGDHWRKPPMKGIVFLLYHPGPAKTTAAGVPFRAKL